MENLPSNTTQEDFYSQLTSRLDQLLGTETNWLANLANAAALLFYNLPQTNWAGFYLLENDCLVLGPFQGKPACIRIPVGKGVCGSAVAKGTALVVPDVHLFPGHIACDAASRAEIVVPLTLDNEIVGVLDIDSPTTNRFGPTDQVGLERFVQVLAPTLRSMSGYLGGSRYKSS